MGIIKQFLMRDSKEKLYPKTIGQAITIKPGDTPINLDTFLKEFVDNIFPVGEVKTFAAETPNLEFLNKMGQEWVAPEGQLLDRTKYPVLFSLIGYNYGWGDNNPYTDDLDAQGNAKATNTDHPYFRLPDFRANFLRVAGERTLTNEWTDSDGTSHSLETTYKAEMYKRQLDAIRNISGQMTFRSLKGNTDLMARPNTFDSKVFKYTQESWSGEHTCLPDNVYQNNYLLDKLVLDSAREVPVNKDENVSINISISCLIRVA